MPAKKPAPKVPAKAPAKAISPAQAPKTAKMVSAVKAARKLPAFKAAKAVIEKRHASVSSAKPKTLRDAVSREVRVRGAAAEKAAKSVGIQAKSTQKLSQHMSRSASKAESPYEQNMLRGKSEDLMDKAKQLKQNLKALKTTAKGLSSGGGGGGMGRMGKLQPRP